MRVYLKLFVGSVTKSFLSNTVIMHEALILITVISLICSLILWRLLTAQNNKAQAAYSSHRKEHKGVLTKTKAERRELRLLLNAFDDALIITNSKGVIQVVNEASRALCDGRALRGNSVESAFIDKDICEHINNAINSTTPAKKKIVLTESSFGYSSTVTNSAWIIDSAPLPSQDEDTLHRIILRDVTTEHQTDQIKREFVANASHELRTPLAVISGYLENLIDDDVVDSPATARRFLTTIRKHSDRISKLIDEMLTISKLESGDGVQLSMQEFSLNDILSDITDRLAPMITAQNATINRSSRPPEIILTGDPFYWDQALFNLIENALKQNTENPITIDISAVQTDDARVEIQITDDGKGIPSMHVPYIFNRFYRVQKHHSQNKVKGTGLGLSIVKHAIEAHGGNISVTSEPGVFTTFRIISPLNH